MALDLILCANRSLERLFVFAAPALASLLNPIPPDLRQHARGLFTTHYGNTRVRPHPQEAGQIPAAPNAVIAGAEPTPDDHSEFRYARARHSSDQLGAILRDAAR